MKAEIVFVGKERTPTIDAKMTPAPRKCWRGMQRFEMNGEVYYVLVTLMPESVGKVFETKSKEQS